MKKIMSIFAIISIVFGIFSFTNVNAATLDTLDIRLDKQTVHPNENVKVNVQFGKALGAYTFEFAYDNKVLEYVSSEGGTPNNTGDKVIVTFFDTSGGSSSRDNMSITFRAKSDIYTSNPTDISITASGMGNSDASEHYDDITIPIVKNVIVEPIYVDYGISLDYTGDVLKGQEKEMDIKISSSMGKNYEHVRLLAEVSTTSGGIVKMIAIDESHLEHDIIQSGWGDASGYQLGGKDVTQTIKTTSTFSEEGKYDITFKLINRDDSDAVIVTKMFSVDVKNNPIPPTQPGNQEGSSTPETTPGTTPESNQNTSNELNQETTTVTEGQNTQESNEQTTQTETLENGENLLTEETPKVLPKTGTNMYIIVGLTLVGLIVGYQIYKKQERG